MRREGGRGQSISEIIGAQGQGEVRQESHGGIEGLETGEKKGKKEKQRPLMDTGTHKQMGYGRRSMEPVNRSRQQEEAQSSGRGWPGRGEKSFLLSNLEGGEGIAKGGDLVGRVGSCPLLGRLIHLACSDLHLQGDHLPAPGDHHGGV